MKIIAPLLIILAGLVGTAAQSQETNAVEGFLLRNAESIEKAADRLEQELGDQNMVFETIGNYEGHSLYLVLRGKSASAEVHITESDFYIGKRGTAEFIIGGKLVDPVEGSRKQIHGSAIDGGVTHETGPGDIIHVPKNTPHQLIIKPGEPYMYLLFKLDEEPLE